MSLNKAPYPPIVDTWSPAAIMGSTVKIYFALSAYASLADIRPDIVLVTVTNSYSNESAIDYTSNHGQSCIVASIQNEPDRGYFIEFGTQLIKAQLGEVYKVQLRFCSAEVTASKKEVQRDPLNDAWRNYISDYSSVTLLRIISRPQLILNGFSEAGVTANYIISAPSLSIFGKLKFNEVNGNDEVLSHYNIQLFENLDQTATENDTIVLQSEEIFPDLSELNLIYYIVKKDLKNLAHYLMKITYTTSSGYNESKSYHFTVQYESDITTPPPYVWSELDKEDASIKVYILGQSDSTYKGFFILRRTSSESHFTEWEDLKYFYNEEEGPIGEEVSEQGGVSSVKPICVNDYLVKTGVIYRYQVIPMDEAGYRGLWNTSIDPINTN